MRLHPLSIPYKIIIARGPRVFSWFLFLVFFFPVISEKLPFTRFVEVLVLIGLGTAAFLFYVFWEILYHMLFEYNFSGNRFEIHSGVISRRDREIPVSRIQNVDINRNFLLRLIGLAEVRLESAGGSDTEGLLRYVDHEQALAVRDRIRALKQEHGDAVDEQPEEAESILFEMSTREFLLLCVIRFDPRFIAGVLTLLPAFMFLNQWVLGGFLVIAAAGSWILGMFKNFDKYYGFKLYRHSDSLEYERGFLGRKSGHIPLGKIQKMIVRENLFMRLLGLASLEVETAGYGPGTAEEYGPEAAVPLARRERLVELAHTIDAFEDLEVNHPPVRARTRFGVRYTVLLLAFTALLLGIFQIRDYSFHPDLWFLHYLWLSPILFLPVVPIAAHLKWVHLGYGVKQDHIITREGFWNRTTTIVPYYRIQNGIEYQSILQRFWDISTLVLDTAGSYSMFGSESRAVDLDANYTEQLNREALGNLRKSLALRRKEQIREEPPPPEDSQTGDFGFMLPEGDES